jgi:hypothetical protein
MTDQLSSGDQLYREVIKVTEEYLGPAAERFVARQISFHLNKSPQDLTSADLSKLIEWAKVTLGLLTEDRDVVDEYERKLTNLAHSQVKS